MIGLAFEWHDARSKAEKGLIQCLNHRLGKEEAPGDNARRLELIYKHISRPTINDVFHYAFCHAGILTGNTR